MHYVPSIHVHDFYRATHMHSADYAVATCMSDRSSLCLSNSPSICHTTDLPPCTHVFLSSFFVSVCQYTCLSVTFIRTISSRYVCVFASICPYIMFTAMCPCVCLPHSCILYVPFVHFYDCLSTYMSLCMSIFMQIYYMYSCLSVCLLHSCAILAIHVCVSSCPFV